MIGRPKKPIRKVRLAIPDDLTFIYDLQRKLEDQVGHAPRGALLDRINTDRIVIVTENDEPAGYLNFSHRKDRKTHISQVAIHPHVWRTQAGTRLMNLIRRAAVDAGSWCITLHTAVDLPANLFWPTLDYRPQTITQGKRRPALHWALDLYRDPAPPIITAIRRPPKRPPEPATVQGVL